VTDRPLSVGEEPVEAAAAASTGPGPSGVPDAPDASGSGGDPVVDSDVPGPGEDTGAEEAVNTEAVNDEPGPAAAARHSAAPGAAGDVEHPDTLLAAERLADLQRLSAEYVNYKRRVDRDRAVMQERAVHDVLESLLPVLDDIHAARQHGDLVDGPFAAIADKLEVTLGKYGLQRYGEAGREFDPTEHEALMHLPWDASHAELVEDPKATTVVQVLQPGYRAGEQVLRPARVAVADPE
jgi:molecular chaperone GrpE